MPKVPASNAGQSKRLWFSSGLRSFCHVTSLTWLPSVDIMAIILQSCRSGHVKEYLHKDYVTIPRHAQPSIHRRSLMRQSCTHSAPAYKPIIAPYEITIREVDALRISLLPTLEWKTVCLPVVYREQRNLIYSRRRVKLLIFPVDGVPWRCNFLFKIAK